jgi:hypothetical protein
MKLKPLLLRSYWILSAQFGIDPRKTLHSLQGLSRYVRDLFRLRSNRDVLQKKMFSGLPYVLGNLGALYFKVRGGRKADGLACFGWYCVTGRLVTMVNLP